MRQAAWFVSSQHSYPVTHTQPRTPYGERHARQPGSRYTACGISALGWTIFWELPFSGTEPTNCAECCSVVHGVMMS
jgi:hypothetical protein